ncbi:MAG: serine dehydrogenasease [Rubellimicrobium sp.]|nr:serine dehydrogenasease [Rubellimicrobium sp.]
MEAINVDQLTRTVLAQANMAIAKKMRGDVVFMNCGIFPPLDDEFRVAIETIREDSDNSHLVVLLETTGGLMETAERLVAVMRTHYDDVSFVIPNYAYSAGTVLALSGDRILMDYYSVLGPIDPQYRSADGTYLPGHGIIVKFKELMKAVNSAGSSDDVRAELALLVKSFDPAQLFQIEQSIEHGITLITEWLPRYKFKNWTETHGTGRAVSQEMKKSRARDIATTLGDASKWHSHGRGISMDRLMSEELKLMVDDFGIDRELSSAIRNYHGLASDYLYGKLGMQGFVHTQKDTRRIA